MTEAPYTLTRKDIGGSQDWLVIRANTTDELLRLDGDASLIVATLRENRGVYNAAAVGNVVSQQAAPAPAAAPAQVTAQGVPTPTCAHGARVYREAKPGSGKNWKAWFCPTPQGTPNQCKPEFI